MARVAALASLLIFLQPAAAEELCEGAMCKRDVVVDAEALLSEEKQLHMLQMRGYAKYAEEGGLNAQDKVIKLGEAAQAQTTALKAEADEQINIVNELFNKADQLASSASNTEHDQAAILAQRMKAGEEVVAQPEMPHWVKGSNWLSQIYSMAADKAKQHKEAALLESAAQRASP
mmetsp:Transcript_77006/g.145121  ORF Transcript_77006/g.145121 Transcript_77006/m.145121 type:complete len:175 (-) Transcript_77006:93-617(-)